MASWFETGGIVLIILGLVVIEAALLAVYRIRTKRGIALVPMIANLIAGGCLMLGIRAALMDQHWTWIGTFMAMALLAHLVDFGSRLLAEPSDGDVG